MLLLATLLVFSLTVAAQSLAPAVYGLSNEQKKLLTKNILYYNLTCGSGASETTDGQTGSDVYLLGDSIMVGAYFTHGFLKNKLTAAGWSSKADASGGRGMAYPGSDPRGNLPGKNKSGLEAITADEEAIKSSDTVVIELGTNQSNIDLSEAESTNIFAGQMREAISKVRSINDTAEIYWVKLFSDSVPSITPYINAYNRKIESIAANKNINLIDPTGENIPLADKIHPTTEGYKKLSNVIVSGLGQANSGENTDNFEELDDLNLAGIANKHGLQSAAVRKLGSSKSTSHNANVAPESVASLIKLVIADAFLSTKPNLNKQVTIKSSHIYGGGTPQGTPWDPKVGQKFTLKQVLINALAKSSNTQANVLIDQVGGPGKVNQLTNYNSTNVTSYFKYNGPTGAPNKSTAGDLTNAMNKIFTTKNSRYKVAQEALRDSSYTFGLSSEANKWGGHSGFTGNVGLFDVNGSKYIVSVFLEEKWQDEVLPDFPSTRGTEPSVSVGKLRTATNEIISGIKGSPAKVPSGCSCPNTAIELEGENDAVKVYNFLVNETDLTPAQVSGIIGNLMRETGGDEYDFDPGSISDPSMCIGGSCRGIAQWSASRWAMLEAWANSKDKDPVALETQAEYIKVELEHGYRSTLNALKAISGDTEEAASKAAYEFNASFEIGDNTEQRQANAAKFFSEYVKGGGLTGGSPESDGSCTGGGSGEATGRFIWPVGKEYPLVSCWKNNRGDHLHAGLDIGSPTGTDAVASDGGTVELARNTDPGGYGKVVVIKHDDNKWTLYGHLDQVNVHSGQKVDQGDVIGKTGNTGSSEGPHIHFNIQDNAGEQGDAAQTLNPLDFLPDDGRSLSTGSGTCGPGPSGYR